MIWSTDVCTGKKSKIENNVIVFFIFIQERTSASHGSVPHLNLNYFIFIKIIIFLIAIFFFELSQTTLWN